MIPRFPTAPGPKPAGNARTWSSTTRITRPSPTSAARRLTPGNPRSPKAAAGRSETSESRRLDQEALRLRIYPDPALFERARPLAIEDSGAAIQGRVDEMFQIMYQAGGIGLAGPQVAWSRRIFVINLTGEPAETDCEMVFVNPEISEPEGRDTMEEGCLSLPEIRADVSRPERIHVRALDAQGRPFEVTAFGLLARCIQHEYDHLDGILFVKRLSITARLGVKRALKELERKYAAGGAR